MRNLTLILVVPAVFWAILTSLAAYQGYQDGLWSDVPGNWERLKAERTEAICHVQYAHREASIAAALGEDSKQNADLFKPMYPSFLLELGIMASAVMLSSVFLVIISAYRDKLSPDFAGKLLTRTLILSGVVFLIEVVRYYFSSVVDQEKDLFTWTSWCIADVDLVYKSYAGDFFAFFIFCIPLVSVWIITDQEHTPELDPAAIDGHCGIKDHIILLKRTMYVIYSMVVALCFFWIEYIPTAGGAGPVYLIQPVAYSLLMTLFMARISVQAVRIRLNYTELRQAHIRYLENDRGLAPGKLKWFEFADSNFPSDPTDPILGDSGLEYLKSFVIATIGPAIGIMIFLLKN